MKSYTLRSDVFTLWLLHFYFFQVPAPGTGLTTAALVEAGGVGVEVERGPDWYEDDQDGGIGSTGVVMGFLDENGEEHGEYVEESLQV